MIDDAPRSPPLTASTKNFRQSTHLIPTVRQEERPKPYEPPQLTLWVILPASLFMIALGVALEVALSISNRNNGFSVPERNVFKFASQQFLTHFIPVVFVAPLALLWESKNWLVKRYQPYLNLARGDATADNSLLLDYISLSVPWCLWEAFIRRHWLVVISAICGLIALLLQPLAGSIFDVSQLPEPTPSTVQSLRTIGLDPDRFELTNFLGGAGYVLAAVTNNLTDPPFIHGNWAAADFVFPSGDYLNGTVSVNTTGIRQNATCTAPTNVALTQAPSPTNFTINASSQAGCAATVFFNPGNSNTQYGVTNVPNCGAHAGSVNATFQPVFFWFYNSVSATSGQPQAAGVFCSPTLEVFNIAANASLNDASLGNVTIRSNFAQSNPIAGPPLNGIPFNGVVFEQADISNEFVQARATAINNGVPGAILRSVTTNASISGNAFNTVKFDGFVETTAKIYTQHLSIIAKTTYFLPTSEPLSAVTISLKPRLVIEPLTAHFLAIILILIGLCMMTVGLIHRSIRKSVYLAAPPGSIASAVALTSHSGFGMFLVPYDTEVDIASKLDPLLFSLDKRTGAIVANDKPGYEFVRGDDEPGAGEKASPEKLSRRSLSVGSRDGAAGAPLLRESSPLMQAGYVVEPFSPPSSPPAGGHNT